MSERKMLKDLQKAEAPGKIPLFVTAIKNLEYNERGQAFMHVFVTDGEEVADLPMKDARIQLAKDRFEGKAVDVTVGFDGDNPYIAKIELNSMTSDDFGDLAKAVPEAVEAVAEEKERPRLTDAKKFVDRDFTLPALLTEVKDKKTKNGDSYCAISVTDGETSASFNWWNIATGDVKERYLGKVIYLTVLMGQYPKVVRAELCEDFPVTEFVPTVPISPEEMYDHIIFELLGMKTSTMAPIVMKLFDDNREKLLRWAAALKFHHSIYGGLLYHIYRMMEAAKALMDVYSHLNYDLLLLGVIVHDIGKLRELNTNELGVTEFMTDGNLEGHILLGIEMLTEAVYSLPPEDRPNEEEFRLLKHMIASHHGKAEWGAAVQPAIPEAMVLHNLDMIDSRMYMFEDAAKGLEAGETSDPVYTLDGARVYKPIPYPDPVPEQETPSDQQ